MERLLEALKKFIPSDQLREVEKAVEEMVAEVTAQIEEQKEAEKNAELEKAYDQLTEELATSEATTVEGYKQAYAYIQDQEIRLARLSEEKDNERDDGFTEA